MKRSIFFAAAAATCISVPALAADMPVKARMLAPAPISGWTGFYIGANIGYAWQESSSVAFRGNDPEMTALLDGTRFAGGTPIGPVSFRGNGLTGGFQGGYNWQVNPMWVVGLEADFSFSDINGSGTGTSVVLGFPFATQSITASQTVDWYGTLRARAGILATPNTLLYGTAGFAYGRVKENVHYDFAGGTLNATVNNFQINCPGANPNNCVVGNSARTATGWTAGAGVEHRISQNISLRAEYLYVNLGSASVNAVGQGALAPGNLPVSFAANYSDTTFHNVRFGANYKY